MRQYPLVYIIVLNWNGYKDTIECLDSLLQLNYPNYRIVICDNNSQDSSVEKIQEWAYSHQIDFKYIDYNPHSKIGFTEESKPQATNNRQITLIQTGKNLGFAGGNNVGIRYALLDSECQYVWILNNDTVVEPEALSALVERVQQDSKIGICGSKLLYYDDRSKVQAWGGAKYNKWIGSSRAIGFGEMSDQCVDINYVEKNIDYVVGASMLVSIDLITTIGLMNDKYFLYFEEIDWSTRAKEKYRLGYAEGSIIYHKEGSSTGANSVKSTSTYTSDFFIVRSALVYTKEHCPIALPIVYIKSLLKLIVLTIKTKQINRLFIALVVFR
jgi:GT2 family glycosyltransferase